MTDIEVITNDGYRLGATRFGPAQPNGGVVLVSGAMGVSQRYYAAFSEWLSERDYTVYTFDYRGVGRSAPRSLRGFQATLTDWVQRDCTAMVGAVADAADGRPVVWLGHSLGGQILPMVPNAARVTNMAMVAAGNGYWRLHDRGMRVKAAALWYALSRPAIAVSGYFPGRRLGVVHDLPAGVMLQWRRWCLDAQYCAGVEGAVDAFAAFTTPIASLSFTDDEMMSARNIEGLHGLLRDAPLNAVRLAPRDIGAKSIGHFGAFRAASASSLWPRIEALLAKPS